MVKDYFGKKWLLDILMHFFWTKTERFSQCHIQFARDLYHAILEEIKENHCGNEKVDYSEGKFAEFESVCRQSAEVFYLEQRIRRLDEFLSKKEDVL
jgi:hypothetical protein